MDFPFQRRGSLVICLSEEDMPELQALYDRGVASGVKGLQILNREEVLEMEPNVVDQVYAALYAPTAGIVCPFHLNIALAKMHTQMELTSDSIQKYWILLIISKQKI